MTDSPLPKTIQYKTLKADVMKGRLPVIVQKDSPLVPFLDEEGIPYRTYEKITTDVISAFKDEGEH